MTKRAVHKSNGGRIGDGTRTTRISEDGSKFEVMVDIKTERYSEIVFIDDGQPEPVDPPAEEPEEEPGEEAPEEEAPAEEEGEEGEGSGEGETGEEDGEEQPAPSPTPTPTPTPVPTPTPTTPPIVGSNVVKSEAELTAAVLAAKKANKPIDVQVSGHIPNMRLNGLMGSAVARVFPKGSSDSIGGVYGTNMEAFEIHGLRVEPAAGVLPAQPGVSALFRFEPSTKGIRLYDLECMGFNGAKPNGKTGGYYDWTQAQWNARATRGVWLRGADSSGERLSLYGVYHALEAEGDRVRFQSCKAEGIAGDFLRDMIGNDQELLYNIGKNLYQIDGNHSDGSQTWSDDPATPGVGDGVVFRHKIIGNKVYEWVGSGAPKAPLAQAQGISGFDGMFSDFEITDNLVIVSAYHGFGWAGLLNSVLKRNVALHAQKIRSNYPWIDIGPHKNGTPSKGNTVTDNVAASFQLQGCTSANNVVPQYTNPAAPNYYDVDKLLAAA